ncbi:MAG: hypothetical protein SAL70_07140 [Scytonema sp. PMC 1070.18]|nr:hypothetical protein [Scytonema sp. PMC 1070.18]
MIDSRPGFNDTNAIATFNRQLMINFRITLNTITTNKNKSQCK